LIFTATAPLVVYIAAQWVSKHYMVWLYI